MSKLNKKEIQGYTVSAIENMMSLRKPQKRSVQILDNILDEIDLGKNIDLQEAQDTVRDLFPIFKDFEHNFMSLTFELATGVGKTKLMGAFITYLYANKGVRNFFVVAPNMTIYSKLKNDLGNPSPDNEKYVFRGVSCFAVNKPNVWIDNDYKNRPINSMLDNPNSINIYIFNISKFNSEERNMKYLNEYIGQSFYDYLSSLDDLVIIMDESHHYRAKSSAEAINALKPVLGIELTATPQVQSGSKTLLFRNVVYEYPLSKAIKDGYTRTPYALTRKDIKSYNLTEDELDKTMISDGIVHHERMKAILNAYSVNNQVKLVKPFMLIVCKDTVHAEKVLTYIKSDSFRNGEYKDKVIVVHSNQKGEEKEENVQKLLEVEKVDNPVEIVIHVNILKEGWDVNNLYTIVPLRTATSKTLREQTVGRGLRLPYGKRTGDEMVDSVTITAHDKFDEIIREAQKGDSIFRADGVIFADDEEKKKIVSAQMRLFDENENRGQVLTSAGLDHNKEENKQLYNEVMGSFVNVANNLKKSEPTKKLDSKKIAEEMKQDLGERFKNNTDMQAIFDAMMSSVNAGKMVESFEKKVMYIPKIKTENFGNETYIIKDFDLDLSQMSYVPIENDLMMKDLINTRKEAITMKGEVIDFDSVKPEKVLVDNIRTISEIDYEKCPQIIQKVVMQFLSYYRAKYTEDKVRNICLMYRKDIVNKFKEQLLQNLAVHYDDLTETVQGIETVVNKYFVDVTGGIKDLYEEPGLENIRSITYNGGKKAVVEPYKFDSDPERKFAIACENSSEVLQWLRPAPTQFNITYNRGHRYEPDFVVETEDMYYLVEVKASNKMNDPDVIAKKERAISYCKVASEYNKANGHKGFKYIFIPHDEISTSSSFNNLLKRFLVD